MTPGSGARRPDAREYLGQVGRMCAHIAQSPDDREVAAAIRTLLDMPALLCRNGLAPGGLPALGEETFNLAGLEAISGTDSGAAA